MAAACGDAKQAANWVTQDVLREMKERKARDRSISDPRRRAGVAPPENRPAANHDQQRTHRVRDTPGRQRVRGPATAEDVEQIIAEKSLAITSGASELAPVIDAVLAANAKIVADVQGGKQQAIGALIGQVMRQAKGADPQVVREMLLDKDRVVVRNSRCAFGDRTATA